MRGAAAYLFSPNVPTLAMRQGDFTGLAALKNPFTGATPYSGNTILARYLSPQALADAESLPAAAEFRSAFA